MKFTFDAFKNLIDMIIQKGYTFSRYSDYANYQKPCILRHDVDFDIQIAEQFAKMEQEIGGGVKVSPILFCFLLIFIMYIPRIIVFRFGI